MQTENLDPVSGAEKNLSAVSLVVENPYLSLGRSKNVS